MIRLGIPHPLGLVRENSLCLEEIPGGVGVVEHWSIGEKICLALISLLVKKTARLFFYSPYCSSNSSITDKNSFGNHSLTLEAISGGTFL